MNSSQQNKKKVAIFGGGISGLTVAHECISKGMEVHLFEKKHYFGGKAFGFKDEQGRPIEHSIRTYTEHYYCMAQTLKEIPFAGGKTAFDNLVPMPGVYIRSRIWSRQTSKINYLLPTFFSVPRWKKFLDINRNLKLWKLSFLDRLSFFSLSFDYILKSQKRRDKTYKNQSFEEYVHLKSKSEPFRQYITSLLDIIVAAKPNSHADILLSLFSRIIHSREPKTGDFKSTYNVMNGPTSERFIEPWVKELTRQGVQFHPSSALTQIVLDGDNRVKHGVVNEEEITADAYVLALHYNQTKKLAPFLHLPSKLNHEWTFGIQFYLKRIPPMFRNPQTFSTVFDSPWKILYLLEAPPLWKDVAFPEGIQGILSVTLSNVINPGVQIRKSVYECSVEELKQEVLYQMGFEDHEAILDSHLDPTVACLKEEDYQKNKAQYEDWEKSEPNALGYRWLTETSLYIPRPGQPKVNTKTSLSNLFLAGEFVDTSFKTPTMEQANESGKLCASALCEYFTIDYEKSRFERPELPFQFIRKFDEWLFNLFNAQK